MDVDPSVLAFSAGLPALQYRAVGDSGMGDIVLVVQGEVLLRMEFALPWQREARSGGSQFLPAACRLELTGPPADRKRGVPAPLVKTPLFDVSHLVLAHPKWVQRMGDLPAELRTILSGRYVISKHGHIIRPIYKRNLPSWDENPDAQDALWPVIAKMFWKGVLTYIRRHCKLPLCILAAGAVPKSTPPFWRLVIDCRPINEMADKWRVRYVSIKSLGLILGYNSIFCVLDLDAAYHLTVMQGCPRGWQRVVRWILAKTGDRYEPLESKHFGCEDHNCGVGCDRSMMGLNLSGHICRLEATPFGHTTSHGPLAVIVECFVAYLSRRLDMDATSYVDDLLAALRAEEHGICAGVAGQCARCLARFSEASRREKQILRIMDELHLPRSSKGSGMTQVGLYIGVICDTNAGRYRITPEKLEKIMASLQELLAKDEYTPRLASKIQGRLVNYGQCVELVRPFTVPFTLFIGAPSSDFEWDQPKQDLRQIHATARFLLEVFPRQAAKGAPMWPLEASTIYDRWQRRLPLPHDVVVVTYDAAEFGVGVSVRLDPEEILRVAGRRYDMLTSVMTFEQDLPVQVWREAWAGPLALQVALDVIRSNGLRPGAGSRQCLVLLRNDCSGALHALEKGSTRSPQLQAASVVTHEICLRESLLFYGLHVSGEQLIAEGVDDGSRKEAKLLRGPKSGPRLRSTVFSFAHAHGFVITMDFFASSCNAIVERFASWTNEPASEQTDAFAARTWDTTACPSCGRHHREHGFFFPPLGLEERVVRRARSDGAIGIFLVPTRHRAGYWLALRRAALAMQLLEESECDFEYCSKGLGPFTIFLVDFGGGSGSSPLCASAGSRRGYGRVVDRTEEREAEALRSCLREMQGTR